MTDFSLSLRLSPVPPSWCAEALASVEGEGCRRRKWAYNVAYELKYFSIRLGYGI